MFYPALSLSALTVFSAFAGEKTDPLRSEPELPRDPVEIPFAKGLQNRTIHDAREARHEFLRGAAIIHLVLREFLWNQRQLFAARRRRRLWTSGIPRFQLSGRVMMTGAVGRYRTASFQRNPTVKAADDRSSPEPPAVSPIAKGNPSEDFPHGNPQGSRHQGLLLQEVGEAF